MRLNDKVIEIVESYGFFVGEVEKQGNDFYVEINQNTPLGEDWWEVIWFDGTSEGFIEAVRERYNNFDVDEEAEVYIDNRGKNGVPDSIRDLLDDAVWKEKTLGELADELEELESEEDETDILNMDRKKFMEYIEENFDISGEAKRLINNILYYVELQGVDEDEQYMMLSCMLDGTIGLSDNEIKKICL